MGNTVRFIALGLCLALGFFFLINSEYANKPSVDTTQKVLAGVLFFVFIGGIFVATKSKK